MQLQFPAKPAGFTKAEQKILEYIGSHTDVFLFLSIGQLADRLGVSDATISRFARHVGCRDFKDLKSVVVRQNTGEGPAAKMAGTLLRQPGFKVDTWLLQQQLCLQKTLEQLNTAEFDRAVQAILDARRVFIHAKSASAALGQLLMFRLRRLGMAVSVLPSGGSEVLEGLAQAGKGDLIVLFSFAKISWEGRMILDYKKSAGCRVLIFSSRLYAPLEEQGDINLFVYRGEIKEYHSMAAPAALVDALVVALSEKMGAASVRQLSRLHELKETYQ